MICRQIFKHYNCLIVEGGISIYDNYLPIAPITAVTSDSIVAYNDLAGYDIDFKECNKRDMSFSFFTVQNDSEYLMGLYSLSLFNQFSHSIQFYCSKKFINSFKKFANENIRFVAFDLKTPQRIIVNTVITYSLFSLSFIKRNIPTIILGPNGLGGLVTKDSFFFLNQYGFLGRPHGVQWEHLPNQIFEAELMNSKRRKDISEVLEYNSKLIENLSYIPYSGLTLYLKNANLHKSKIESQQQKWEIVPMISDQIKFKHTGDNSFLAISKCLNKTVLELSGSQFLVLIDGARSFRDIFLLSGLSDTKFWKTIQRLLKYKVIKY